MVCKACNRPVRAVRATIDPRAARHRFTAGCGHELPARAARALWQSGMRWPMPPIRGATLIDAERLRHVREEGHLPAADAERTSSELAWAAWCLLDRAAADADPAHDGPPQVWPLPRDRWPSGKSPLRLLIIAGSFIAAEIDRRLTAGETP